MPAPSFVVSSALDAADVDHTVEAVAQVSAVYRKHWTRATRRRG